MSAVVRSKPALKPCWLQVRRRFSLMIIAVLGLGVVHLPAFAFETLTSAQKLIYDTAHLANTVAGQQINYRYRSRLGDGGIVSDRVLLTIKKSHADNKRDVVLDFLSAERHMNLPDFSGYRGNPVIIAMLEHIAQGLGQDTGGGVLYFRNRIRDALARSDNRIEQITVKIGERDVDATRLHFSPFVGDKNLASSPVFTGAEFSIVFSDAAPGGVVAVGVKSSQNTPPAFEREIAIE